ncbi:gluconate 2-dehydrogenase subunit 3 family protein [Steroidobacter sp.]|uniref:gluconate 2-dehydrogenase subunit 3 family protein n=1 Tax=Steroidobacter sp. TaxID=1978227 RepID=UPI001A367529|nr:gluconate 2-dehydrogenase subunit 3 family protein [Steroidobacter sp.]MBL8264968.1 gluconate 2-dehydrogenase subunit 3 family protein [Steroidobacter sp.]
MNRRELLVSLAAAGFVLTDSASVAVEAGVRGAKIARGEAGKVLSASQAAFVEVVSDLIIPRTTTPGASDVGVVGFIDHMQAEFATPEARTKFLRGLDELMQRAATELRRDLVAASKAKRLQFVAKLDAEAYATSERTFFRDLKSSVVAAYCSSEAGATQLLEYLPVPGGFKPSIAVTGATRNYAT